MRKRLRKLSKEDCNRIASTIINGELLIVLILVPWWTELLAFYFGQWI